MFEFLPAELNLAKMKIWGVDPIYFLFCDILARLLWVSVEARRARQKNRYLQIAEPCKEECIKIIDVCRINCSFTRK